ncbi:MAG: tRNA 4-thiouridine(8) synthase ThiI [Candidatus Nanoarchaeia archaeon]|nr:tRNA 4-thiouridine(8) synthase ThiI [Candidatus Nanoarchaeia archaeon]
MYDYIIIHYSEIGTKGENKVIFENKLVENIKKALRDKVKDTKKKYGFIACELDKKYDKENLINILSKIPGVAYFSFSKISKLDMKDLTEKSLRLLENLKFNSFKVCSRRSNKGFEKNSQEINKILGELIIKSLNKKVEVSKPDLELFVEVGHKEIFIYHEKLKGIGGLPVDSSSNILCSLSGGIDSPVAAYLMMKRGCKVTFVHIFNKTINQGVLSKINELIERLNKIQLESKLYIVPFEEIQKEIIKRVQSDSRMIIYRRFMMKIINEIAKKEKINVMITGDNLGQVASQTGENLRCIYDSSNLVILTPLIGMNKEEIIEIGKRIGTYEISIKPYSDCCSFMIAKNPKTKARLRDIIKIEEEIENREELIKKAVLNSEERFITY